MEYTYPKISNCLTYKKRDDNSVEVVDYLLDEAYIMEVEEARFVKKLDGKTHPYKIKTNLSQEEIDILIAELDDCGLLKESDVLVSCAEASMKTIWEPKWTIGLKLIAFLFNNILLVSWLPLLIMGIVLFTKNFMTIEFDLMWPGYIIGIVFGIFLHEFGHAFAGVSYGAKVFEMGILRMHYIIPGAYVLMDEKNVKNRLKRVQIYAAGVETNLLLVGVFLILGSIFGSLGGMFMVAAIQNVFLAALNLTLIKGLDGFSIISELLGIEDLIEKATQVTFSRKKKQKLRESGLAGSVTIGACYMISAFQLALPLLLIMNILEVIACFV